MKKVSMTLAFIAVFGISQQALALPDGNTPPSMVDVSATFAKARAQLRSYGRDMRDAGSDTDPFALGALDTEGCDVNIGNVVLDEGGQTPDDIIVFVQGDIIQANNCR